jgi:mannose-6-phosphate isomerase-like protein (cupin superfamily)
MTDLEQRPPLSIPLPPEGEPYRKLLGTNSASGMRSGCVTLSPGEAVGMHSTNHGEELILPLSGCGELRSPGFAPLAVTPGCVIYNPPDTPHEVVNTGDKPLRYIYVYAPLPGETTKTKG